MFYQHEQICRIYLAIIKKHWQHALLTSAYHYAPLLSDLNDHNRSLVWQLRMVHIANSESAKIGDHPNVSYTDTVWSHMLCVKPRVFYKNLQNSGCVPGLQVWHRITVQSLKIPIRNDSLSSFPATNHHYYFLLSFEYRWTGHSLSVLIGFFWCYTPNVGFTPHTHKYCRKPTSQNHL